MLQKNISLKPFNTFSVEVFAEYFAQVTTLQQLRELLMHTEMQLMPKLILGGGSNILLINNFPGLVLQIAILGIEIVAEDDEAVWLSVGAGENWHQLVGYCVQKEYAGIENLSLIPGTVGAAPIQNIGAYGVELKDVFHELVAMNRLTGELHRFNHTACKFGYRDSVFKNILKEQFVITQVILKLSKKPCFQLQYAELKKMLGDCDVDKLTLSDVSRVVCEIRQHKLPDPKKIANAGSFFKNPVIDRGELNRLQQHYPKIPYYLTELSQYKISAAWLIEQCGWKGYRQGDVGVYENHALVLVNYGEASGSQLEGLAMNIQESVQQKFSVCLEMEVNKI